MTRLTNAHPSTAVTIPQTQTCSRDEAPSSAHQNTIHSFSVLLCISAHLSSILCKSCTIVPV